MTHFDARGIARRTAEQGFALIARAINACDNPDIPYQFSEIDRTRVINALIEVQDVVEHGIIQVSQVEAAKKDMKYQTFRVKLLSGVLKE